MSTDELYEIGRILAAVTSLQRKLEETNGIVMQLQSQVIQLQKTNQDLATEVLRMRHELKILTNPGDTAPDCPVLLSDAPPSTRVKLHSVSDDEPDSVVTRQISVHAGPIELRGPGIVVGAILALGGLLTAAYLYLSGGK